MMGRRMMGGMAGLARTGKRASRGIMNYAKDRPMRAGAMGVAGLGTAGYVTRGRRGRGVDKAEPGRPTGMYRY